MITVHHLEDSRSQRILWLLEELGLEYQIKHYARDKKTQLAPPELKQVHPLGKSPVLEDSGEIVAESGAIIEYLIDRYDSEGRLRPSREQASEWRDYTYWLHFAEGSLMPFMVMMKVFMTVKTAPMPFFVRPIAKRIAGEVEKSFIMPTLVSEFDYIETWLGEHEWFAGEQLSGADFQMSFPLEAAKSRMPGDYPNIRAWVDKVHARSAYQAGLEKGGEYSYA